VPDRLVPVGKPQFVGLDPVDGGLFLPRQHASLPLVLLSASARAAPILADRLPRERSEPA
jgi:hypothetical protein